MNTLFLQNEGFCPRGYSGSLDYRFGDGPDGSMEIYPPIMPDINGTVHRMTLTEAYVLENASYSGSIVSDGLMIEVNFREFHYKWFVTCTCVCVLVYRLE